MTEQRTDYKKEIIQVLEQIPDSDSVYLRQILIILRLHVQKKGGAFHE